MIHEFITSRSQRVVLNGKLSDWTKMHSGLPQGFLFVNDIPSSTSNFSQIHNYNDQMQFQHDTDSLIQWCELWQLTNKCTVLHLGMTNPHHTYQMGYHSLEPSDYQKDLGVIVDGKLNFHIHTLCISDV